MYTGTGHNRDTIGTQGRGRRALPQYTTHIHPHPEDHCLTELSLVRPGVETDRAARQVRSHTSTDTTHPPAGFTRQNTTPRARYTSHRIGYAVQQDSRTTMACFGLLLLGAVARSGSDPAARRTWFHTRTRATLTPTRGSRSHTLRDTGTGAPRAWRHARATHPGTLETAQGSQDTCGLYRPHPHTHARAHSPTRPLHPTSRVRMTAPLRQGQASRRRDGGAASLLD